MWTLAFLMLLCVNAVVIVGSEGLTSGDEERPEELESILNASDSATLDWRPLPKEPGELERIAEMGDLGRMPLNSPPSFEPERHNLESDYSGLMSGYLDRLTVYLGKFYRLGRIAMDEDATNE